MRLRRRGVNPVQSSRLTSLTARTFTAVDRHRIGECFAAHLRIRCSPSPHRARACSAGSSRRVERVYGLGESRIDQRGSQCPGEETTKGRWTARRVTAVHAKRLQQAQGELAKLVECGVVKAMGLPVDVVPIEHCPAKSRAGVGRDRVCESPILGVVSMATIGSSSASSSIANATPSTIALSGVVRPCRCRVSLSRKPSPDRIAVATCRARVLGK